MASRRRTAEDKNTKLLREIAAIPTNKQCFDCLQRGPTYINVTIGSFVCTTCSGILRGLTPPHRLKSISMTTFTPEEIESLKSRGNEYCKYVWLGTYDSNLENEITDDQKKRDFMIQKYEKKRWYVDPDVAIKKMQSDQLQRQKTMATQPQSYGLKTNLPETQPLSRLLGKSPTPLVIQNQPTETWPHPVSSASAPAISTKTTAQNHSSRSIDLLFELSGNNLNSSTNAPGASSKPSTANGNFANFANFESAFNSSTVEKSGWTSFEDDLDPLSVSHTTTLGKDSSFPRTGAYSTAMPRPLSLPTFAPTNPFKSPPLAANPKTSTPNQWPSFAAPPPSNLPSSASLDTYHHLRQTEPPKVLSPPPVVSKATLSAAQQSTADRYAALADLDSLFHLPVQTKAPSWTVETSSASSGSFFDVPKTSSTSSTAPSNPFTSTELWGLPQATKPVPSFQSPNPFQAAADNSTLAYTQQSSASQAYAPFPIPMVGSSPSEDVQRQFSANFVASPTNGYPPPGGQMLLQNGGYASPPPGTTGWGQSVHPWVSSQMGQTGLFSNDSKPVEVAQHSDWIQNPINPFMVSQTNTLGFPVVPRNNSSNPFL